MHDLIKDNQIIKSHDFKDETPPVLSSNKGKWFKRIEILIVEQPTILQKIETNHTITDNQSIYEQVIVDKTQEELEVLKIQKLNELANLRYQKETAGIIVNDSTIKTDRESQAMVTGAYNAVQIDPTKIIDWKGEDGWIQLDATAITAIASAVSDHVQACFTREKELSILLETDIEIDITTGWPE